MGKCVSKRSLTHDSRFSQGHQSSCDEIEWERITSIYRNNNNLNLRENAEGQTESKRSTKVKGPETKGTAMSFGFKKKSVYTGTTKKIQVESAKTDKDHNSDDNGNTGTNGSMDSVHDNSNTSNNNNNNRTRLKPPTKTKDTTATNVRSNRFGFRNTIRPASVGLQPKHTDVSGDDDSTAVHHNNKQDENLVNNNGSHGSDVVGVGGVKKRSKSAVASVRNTVVSFNETVMVQPVPVERRGSKQSLKTGGESANSTTKYTLHSTSLPKPQQPIPIQVRPVMDTKDVKHAMNLSRRQFFGLTSDSSDSGVVSDDSRRSQRLSTPVRHIGQRNLEMVRNGRHTFEVRDLEKLTAAPTVPLALPRLPSVFRNNNYQIAPIGDLVRPVVADNRNENGRQSSLESLEYTESTEEEKLIKDNNSSEKSMMFKKTFLREPSVSSKNSSPGSSRHSWCNAGETMAPKEGSSLSISSTSDDTTTGASRCKDNNEAFIHINKNNSIDEESEDINISSVTCGTTNSISCALSLDLKHSTIYIEDNRETENKEATKEEAKFAEIAATLDNANLLYDETSPTDSLASTSSESENVKKQKHQKTLAECLAEKDQKDLEDISPELEAVSPLSPGTPTHASNSLSLSDVGRDFLIDDEIADQPALLFNDDAPSQALGTSEGVTDTPTLRDPSSVRSAHKTPTRRVLTTYESPASIRRPKLNLSRTGSLDTLSPCESIASDDLMVDFDTRSSMDSIELQNIQTSNNSSGISARSSTDGLPIWQELEHKTGEMIKDWNKLIRANRHSSRESITSQLPARTTRLLNRRLQNNSNQSPSINGSDSPRSIDSFHRRTPNKPSPLLQRSTEDIDLIDKAMKNSLLQEVSCVKKELLRLRRVLQEDDFNVEMSDTLNPFETNGQINPAVLDENRRIDELSQESGHLTMVEDQRHELADLRRQVVFLQSQIDDRDRTIRIQANTITKYETCPNNKTTTTPILNSTNHSISSDTSGIGASVETVNVATQTERLRPLSMGPDHGSSMSSRSELPVPVLKLSRPLPPSSIPQQQHHHTVVIQQQSPAFLKQTQVSSIYTKLSSIKPTTTTTNNKINSNHSSHKTVRTTQIGNVMSSKTAVNAAKNLSNGTIAASNGKLSNHKSSPELRSINEITTTRNGVTSYHNGK